MERFHGESRPCAFLVHCGMCSIAVLLALLLIILVR